MNTTTDFLEFEKISEERPTQQKGLKKGSQKRKLVVTGIVLTCLVIIGLAYNKISKVNNHKKDFEDPNNNWLAATILTRFVVEEKGMPNQDHPWDWEDFAKLNGGEGENQVDFIYGTGIPKDQYAPETADKIKQDLTDQYIICIVAQNMLEKESAACSNQWRVKEAGKMSYISVVVKDLWSDMYTHPMYRELFEEGHFLYSYARIVIFNQLLEKFEDAIQLAYQGKLGSSVILSSKPLVIPVDFGSKIGKDKNFLPLGESDTSKPNFLISFRAQWSFKTLKNTDGQNVKVFGMDSPQSYPANIGS